MRVCLVSTYELGRPSFEAAQAAAHLSGVHVEHRDLSRGDDLHSGGAPWDTLVFLTPMHTATRLALEELPAARARWPSATLIAAGLYGPLNEARLRRAGADHVLGPEMERQLASLVVGGPGSSTGRVRFRTPQRSIHGRLRRFAQLVDGEQKRVSGSTQTTRGCKHKCRHCPIVPVYQGALRAVPLEVVGADIANQVALGAEHINFGDPDFLNAPTHAHGVLDLMEREFPAVTFDVITRVQHLLDMPELHARLARASFVTTAVESFDDDALRILDKGHTRDDFARVLNRSRELGVVLSPTFLPFAPWTTLRGYARFLEELEAFELLDAVSPVQLTIRLLLPARSLLLETPEVSAVAGPFDEDGLVHPWAHPDPAVDALQRALSSAVAAKETREEQLEAALAAAGFARAGRAASCTVPYLEEPWYC